MAVACFIVWKRRVCVVLRMCVAEGWCVHPCAFAVVAALATSLGVAVSVIQNATVTIGNTTYRSLSSNDGPQVQMLLPSDLLYL